MMTDYRRNPDTGQTYAKLPGNRWIEVQPEDVDTIEEGGLEAFVNSAGNSLGQLATGAGTLMGVEGAEEQFRDLQATQDLRHEVNSALSVGGGFLPDVAIGMLTGGTGSIARRAAMTGLIEGTIGAARNPDDPIAGGLVGGAAGMIGGGLAGGLTGAPVRAARRVDQLAPDAPMAARTSAQISDAADDVRMSAARDTEGLGGSPGSVTGNLAEDMAAAQQKGLTARIAGMFERDPPSDTTLADAKRLGLKLTPADLYGDPAMKNMESAIRANPTADAVFNREIMRPNQQAINRLAGRAAGFAEDTSDGITPEMLGQNVDRISAGYDEVAKQIGDVDIDVDPIKTAAMEGSEAMVPEVKATVEAMLKQMPTKVNGETGLAYTADLRESAASAWRQGNSQVAKALDKIAQHVEDQMIDAAKTPKVQQTLKDLRNQWKAQRLLERAGTLTEEGDISFGSLRQGMRADKHLSKGYRRNRDMGSDAFNDLAAATRVLGQFRERIGNSGTPTRNVDFTDYKTYLGAPMAKGYLWAGNRGGAAGAYGGAVVGGAPTAGAGYLGVQAGRGLLGDDE